MMLCEGEGLETGGRKEDLSKSCTDIQPSGLPFSIHN
jgi:hypothetical protein